MAISDTEVDRPKSTQSRAVTAAGWCVWAWAPSLSEAEKDRHVRDLAELRRDDMERLYRALDGVKEPARLLAGAARGYAMLFESVRSVILPTLSRETLRKIPELAALAKAAEAGVASAVDATRQLLAQTDGHDDYHLDRRQWLAIADHLGRVQPAVRLRAHAFASLAAAADARTSLKRTNRAWFIGDVAADLQVALVSVGMSKKAAGITAAEAINSMYAPLLDRPFNENDVRERGKVRRKKARATKVKIKS